MKGNYTFSLKEKNGEENIIITNDKKDGIIKTITCALNKKAQFFKSEEYINLEEEINNNLEKWEKQLKEIEEYEG